jgi:SlyX protein
MNESLEKLETRIAYLEQANADLGDVVYRQQREIDALRDRLTTLVGRLESAQSTDRPWSPAEEKPPHY